MTTRKADAEVPPSDNAQFNPKDTDTPAEVREARGRLADLPSEPYQPTTAAERMATIDDAAIRPDGRLVGVYYEDIAAEQEERLRAQVEGRKVADVSDAWLGTEKDKAAAAAKVRAAAVATPGLPTSEDVGRVPIHPKAGVSAEDAVRRTNEFNEQADAESLAR